jgi:hypothetical protein
MDFFRVRAMCMRTIGPPEHVRGPIRTEGIISLGPEPLKRVWFCIRAYQSHSIGLLRIHVVFVVILLKAAS